MSTNLPLGTYVQDGVRSGPYYKGAPSTIVSPTQQYALYGPGILYSSLNTYSIVPAAPAGGGFTTLNNVAAAQEVPAAGDLTLLGDNSVSKLITGANGQAYVQLDYPRVITATVSNVDIGASVYLNIFGTDWYGNQMQQRYQIINNAPLGETTPKIKKTENNLPNGSISQPAKAFYTITRIAVSGAIGNRVTISIGASDVFGLPYLLQNFGDVINIGWETCANANGLPTTTGELTSNAQDAYVGRSPLVVKGTLIAADQTPPTGVNGVPTADYIAGITGDVRGLYAPSSASDGRNRLRFTQYVYGADAWINQLANTELINNVNNVPNVGVQQNPLNVTNLYGQPQFYSGVPT